MLTFSSSQLPVLIALVAFVFALYVKRETLRSSDLIALAIGATVLFLVLSGALNALHFPSFVLRLF